MSRVKISPDEFLETQELNKLQDMIINDGYKQRLLLNTQTFGIVKGFRTPALNRTPSQVFNVVPGGNTGTIFINGGRAIDVDGNVITMNIGVDNYPVPSTALWYWLAISYAESNIEQGTISIDVSGNVTGSGTLFTQLLRGQPNFPSKIKFPNASINVGEYNVLSVIDDTTVVLSGGAGVFAAESDLQYQIVGTFLPGYSIPNDDKNIFCYDNYSLRLITETSLNVPPSHNADYEFFLARVSYDGSTLLIQDKRNQYWRTKAGYEIKNIDRSTLNPLIGVESVKWDIDTTTRDSNIATVKWGFTSNNFSVDPISKTITLSGGSGGIYKDPTYFNNGDFDKWRLYASDGSYQIITSSIKSGSAIIVTLDALDPIQYNSGNTLVLVPDTETISLMVLPDYAGNPLYEKEQIIEVYTFKTILASAKIKLKVMDASSPYLYSMVYCYGNYKDGSPYNYFPTTAVGHWTEKAFDEQGNILSIPAGNNIATNIAEGYLFPVPSTTANGFIQVVPNPNNYISLLGKAYLGDKYGVNEYDLNSATPPVVRLVVGTDRQYQRYSGGSFSISDDFFINLEKFFDYPANTLPCVNGNYFYIQIKQELIYSSGVIRIVQNYVNPSSYTEIVKLDNNDLSFIKNSPEGMFIRCTFDGTNWIANRVNEINNDALGTVKALYSSNFSADFDSTGLGTSKSWLGWAICNGLNSTPNLAGKTIVGFDAAWGRGGGYVPDTDYTTIGDNGGAKTFTLAAINIPKHRHLGITTAINFGSGAEDPPTIATQLGEAVESNKAASGQRGSHGGPSGDTATQVGIGGFGTNFTTYNSGDATNNIDGQDNVGDPSDSYNPKAIDNRSPYYVLAFVMRIN